MVDDVPGPAAFLAAVVVAEQDVPADGTRLGTRPVLVPKTPCIARIRPNRVCGSAFAFGFTAPFAAVSAPHPGCPPEREAAVSNPAGRLTRRTMPPPGSAERRIE